MFGSLLKIALAPVDLVVSVTADAITLGGSLNDKDVSYTVEAAERLVQNVEDVVSPESKKTGN